MAPILYTYSYSGPVRAVMMAVEALGVKVEYKEVSLAEEKQFSPEFLKINPQHTVPTLDDNGFIVWDSHAIMAYLVQKYGRYDDPLYPRDLRKRAIVNQRLHLDCGVFFPIVLSTISPIIYKRETMIPEDRMDDILKAYHFLDTFLGNSDYVAGSELTIADFSLVTSLTTLDHLISIDPEEHPRITAWIKRMEMLPYYGDVNGKGLILLKRALSGDTTRFK